MSSSSDDKLSERAGVALPGTAADELPIDPLRFVQLGADHMQPARGPRRVIERDIGTAAGHVGRHGHAPRLAGMLDDLALLRASDAH